MKHYDSIDKWNEKYFGHHVFGFDKLDGSCIRIEWNRKLSKKSQFTKGFGKFGTRMEMIQNWRNPYTEAVNLFMDKYSVDLDRIFTDNPICRGNDKITVFCEFLGKNSFAGFHNWEEEHDIVLFDVNLYKRGLMTPNDFIHTFGQLDIPKVIYKGILDEHLIRDIQYNKFNLKEGMVLKGVINNRVFMMKVKTWDWLNRVKELYGEKKMLEY
jgi:hypothetical protein